MSPPAFLQQQRFLVRRITPVLLLVAIMVLALVLSGVAGYFVSLQQRARFEREATTFDSLLRRRLETYQDVLVSSGALWSTDVDIDHAGYHHYTQSLNLSQHLPGALGLGFAQWVTPKQQADFVAAMRRELPQYQVVPTLTQPGAPVAYLEPQIADNTRMLGFDVYSSLPRREAIDKALHTHQPTMTAPLTLIPDQSKGVHRPAVLMFLPVYRESKLYGFSYMAIRINDLMVSLMGKPSGTASGNVNQLSIELFDDNKHFYGQEVAHPVFQQTRPLIVAGRNWAVRYSASENFARDWTAVLPALILLLGTLTALLVYFSYYAQSQALERAEDISESLRVSRAKLERSRAEFESIFRAMSDIAVFTDHTGQILFANEALTRHFGYAPQEVRAQNISLLRHDSRLAALPSGVTSPSSTHPADPERLTTLYTRKNGQTFYGEMQRNNVISQGGKLLGYLEVIHDLSGRLESERALKASEQRYHGVLEAVPSPLWVMNQQGEVTYQNAQYRAYFGTSAPDSSVHPDEAVQYQQQWQHSRQQLQVFRSELRMFTDKGYRYFLVFGAPVLGSNKQVREWVFSAGDIHDRLQAERSARQSEQRYREVLEGMPQMVWLSDPTGTPTYFNQRWYDYAGQHTDPLPLMHPDDRLEFERRWKEARQGSGFFEMEHRLLGQEGGYHTFMTRGVGIRSPQGEMMEWVVTSTDIDDQVYAEWSSRLLATISKQLGSEYLSIGPQDTLLDSNLRSTLSLMNERLAVLSAVWTQDAEGNLASVISQVRGHVREGSLLNHPQVLQSLKSAGSLAEPLVLEHPELQGSGLTGLVLLLLSPAQQANPQSTYLALGFRQPIQVRDLELMQEIAGRIAGALESLRLLQEIQVARQALQEMNNTLELRVAERTAELADANHELEAFGYSVSHDLRTPLRHIMAFGDLVQRDPETVLGKKGTRYLGIVTEAAGRMNQLIDDLLEFSRTSRQELHLGRVPLHQLTQEVIAEQQLSSPGSEAQWHLSPLPDVLGDPSLLRQVLTNLLGNAAKYSSRAPQPTIWVSAHTEGAEVILSIRDNGVGFDTQYADKLFGVFQRLHRPEEFEGSGIGLANVRRIVVRHGGRVWAESVLGQGATFYCSFKAYDGTQS